MNITSIEIKERNTTGIVQPENFDRQQFPGCLRPQVWSQQGAAGIGLANVITPQRSTEA
jgi:hypothetical protein